MTAGRASSAIGRLHRSVLVMFVTITSIAALAPMAAAVTVYTVNTTADNDDAVPGDGHCDFDTAKPGDQCSLRAAIHDANNRANAGGPDEIHFKIPGDTTIVKTIAPLTALPAITRAVTIDGYTQPGSRKNRRLHGRLDTVLKVRVTGKKTTDSETDGFTVSGSSDVTIRGLVIDTWPDRAIQISGSGADDGRYEGNFIGTDPSGTRPRGNGVGVDIEGDADGNNVGGNDPEQRNLISANIAGVIEASSGSNTIARNLIGTDRSGTKDLHNGTIEEPGPGIFLVGARSVVVDNTIAFNVGDGINLTGDATATGHTVRSNSIFSNGGLGFDIVSDANGGNGPNGDGPNTNDGGTLDDADTGPNTLLNSPTIASATRSRSTGLTTVEVKLDTTPNATFDVELFSNPTDTGEGKTPIDFEEMTTVANGTGDAIFVMPDPVPAGRSITATATDANGNTSEFSGTPVIVRSSD